MNLSLRKLLLQKVKNVDGAILASFYRLWYKKIGFGQQTLKLVVLKSEE